MKNITAIILIVIGLIIAFQGCNSYNGFVDKEQNVENAWAKVQSAYQRRADLIPNLVNTVKGYADFEQETLTAVIEARSKATSTTIDANQLTPETMAQFQEAQKGLSGALSRLLVNVERYPELKANQNFLELQAQLEGTENRIKVARDKFNDVVTDYNKSVKRFPGTIFASIFGFQPKSAFEADEGAENAPDVNF
jgi:LemA protein